ncbi:uncharacterized protein LOC143609146 [Bidens hawaiensis]|uniref:uncharacterized protein LOC143609146 n=1 Tax=Bidens hawaiensis TaxID=980011 RepID=UPI00404AF004
MRVHRENLQPKEILELSSFCTRLLGIGDGTLGTPDPNDLQNTKTVEIPSNYIIPYHENALTDLISFIYDQDTLEHPIAMTLSQKAIVCPRNETSQQINMQMLHMTPELAVSYLSTDSLIPHSGDNSDIGSLYPSEYLNLLNFNGMPQHRLQHKVNTPVILLRNVNLGAGLCNGTRLIVTQLLPTRQQ